jgi:integrase
MKQAAESWLAFNAHWKTAPHMRTRIMHLVNNFPAGKPLGSLTRDEINSWSQGLVDVTEFSPNYVRLLMTVGSMLYHWLEGEGLVDRNPFSLANVRRPPPVQFTREPITYGEYKRAVLEASKPREQLPHGGGSEQADYLVGALKIGFFTGLRLGDVARMAWTAEAENFSNWVDLEREVIAAYPGKVRRFRKMVEIPIDPELREWLVEQQARSDDRVWVLPSMRRIFSYNPQGVSRALVTVFERAGIKKSFHCFRHGFVTRLINAGVDPIVIGQMTGQSISTIARYSHVSLDAKRAALANLKLA